MMDAPIIPIRPAKEPIRWGFLAFWLCALAFSGLSYYGLWRLTFFILDAVRSAP